MAKNDKDKKNDVMLVSIEAEQSVLGGLMLSPDALILIGDLLSEADFHHQAHRYIFRAISDLSEKNVPFDAITLGEWMVNNGLGGKAGGPEYLIDLVSQTPSAANIKAWAEIVREKSILRQLADVSGQIMSNCMAPEGRNAKELVAIAESEIFKIAEHGNRKQSYVLAKDATKSAYEEIVKRYDNPGTLSGLSMGYDELDALTSGLQNQDLVIIAARPAMGKTSLSTCIAEHVAIKLEKAVALFTMEMSAEQTAQRMLSSQGRINSSRLRSGQLENEDWSKMTAAITKIANAKFLIDDTPALTTQELGFRARRMKREHDISLIVVDYLQLMQAPGGKENRATEIAEISRSLKALAKELDIPIIALSQLNRGLESRADKRPIMSDLRESGGIEQDADIIIFIYRDEYYNPTSLDVGLAEINLCKHRSGPTGSIKLRFFGEFTRFDSLKYSP